MKNPLCMIGVYKNKQIGISSLLFPTAVNRCVRCGYTWKFAITGDVIELILSDELEKELQAEVEQIKLPKPKELLRIEGPK